MDVESNSNNIKPQSHKDKDTIIEQTPESIKMDILYFKEEVLQELKHLEKNLIQKNKEANDTLKEKISIFEIKYNFLKDNMNSLSSKIIDGKKCEEKLNELFNNKEHLYKETNSNKIKISLLERETHDSINEINELLQKTIIYPGIIGNRGKFNTFHEFIDFVLSESNENINFRNKKIMDLSTFKIKIDKNLNTLGFRIQSNLINCNSYTDRKFEEIQDKLEDVYRRYKKNLDDLRIENSDYVIQLEKDTKDLRIEISNIKRMKTEIYSKIDNGVNKVKKEKEKMIEKLDGYKEDVDIVKDDIIRLEKKIEELIVEKIGILFEEQKKSNDNLDKIKKLFDKYKENIEDKINNLNKKIREEQTLLVKSIEDINGKLNVIASNISNNEKNEEINNNYTLFKDENQSKNNMQSKFSRNNNYMFNKTNLNRINLILPQQKIEIEKGRNKNYKNNNLITPSQISSLDNNDILPNKNIFENLKINRIRKVKNVQSAQNIKNNINWKNDNNIMLSKNENIYCFNGLNDNKIKIKKLSASLNNKNSLKQKSKINYDEEKVYDFNNYVKLYSNVNRRKQKKNSFNHEKIQTLKKFQKLLKININDINAHLNNNNISTTSFKVLNENKEIFDRFYLSHGAISLNDNKYLNIKNSHTNNENKINLYNICSHRNSEKNLIDECLGTKDLTNKKTDCYFNHIDINNKIEQNINKYKKNNKIIFLAKKTNPKKINLKGNIKNRNIGTNSLTRYHNYFIGFYDDENKNDNKSKNKKKKKNKNKSNSINMNYNQMTEDKLYNNDINIKYIKRFEKNKIK